MNEKEILGLNGEKLAQKYLKKKKYKILETNYRCPIGELDIIARDKDTIVFVEVKTRTSCAYGTPREAVNYYKRHKIELLAMYYLNIKKLNNSPARFDVIDVLGDEITHIKDAWQLE